MKFVGMYPLADQASSVSSGGWINSLPSGGHKHQDGSVDGWPDCRCVHSFCKFFCSSTGVSATLARQPYSKQLWIWICKGGRFLPVLAPATEFGENHPAPKPFPQSDWAIRSCTIPSMMSSETFSSPRLMSGLALLASGCRATHVQPSRNISPIFGRCFKQCAGANAMCQL